MSKEVSTCLLVFTRHNSICQEEYDETEHYILIMAHVGTRHRQIEYSSPICTHPQRLIFALIPFSTTNNRFNWRNYSCSLFKRSKLFLFHVYRLLFEQYIIPRGLLNSILGNDSCGKFRSHFSLIIILRSRKPTKQPLKIGSSWSSSPSAHNYPERRQ